MTQPIDFSEPEFPPPGKEIKVTVVMRYTPQTKDGYEYNADGTRRTPEQIRNMTLEDCKNYDEEGYESRDVGLAEILEWGDSKVTFEVVDNGK